MAAFVAGKKRVFLTKVGVPYGFVFGEGFGFFTVIQKEDLRKNLKKLVDDQQIDTDEAQVIEEAADKVGLLPDLNAVFEKVRAFKLPEDFKSQVFFRVCVDCEPSMVHGYIMGGSDGSIVEDGPFADLAAGFKSCDGGFITKDDSRVFSGIFVFQQMLEAGLAKDRSDLIACIEALPDDHPDKMDLVKSREINAEISAEISEALRFIDRMSDAVSLLSGLKSSRDEVHIEETVKGDVPEDAKK